MTTNQHVDTLIDFIARQMSGEQALPSFQSTEFAALVATVRQATEPGANRKTCELVGLGAMRLIMAHLESSMNAERELALLRGPARQ